ncbi:MAG: hypothetical protein KFH98_13575 [Gemmatimonadetes bacterium]|nr:hypothetical protein [Gemmatimonadota bacterium]
MIRTLVLVCLGSCALLLTPASSAAQDASGFDIASLKPPPGFLDLTDLVVHTDADGVVTATATTRLGNAEALVLLSVNPGANGGERQFTIGLKPTGWSLTEAIPALSNPVLDNLTFSNVALVISNQDIDRQSFELDVTEREFYGEVYKSDEFRLVLKPGINLIAAIPAEGLEPGHPMLVVMDALGIEKGTILLQGTLGKSLALIGAPGAGGMDIVRDLYLRAELPPMRPPGSPEWFRSGQIALELTGDPSVRLVGEVNVILDEEELMFFLAASLARSGMTLAGGLRAEDGWQQPFGIPWLILNDVVLALSITPTGSVQPGFAASMVIGEKDIDVAISMAFSPAGVPTSMMLAGESEAGFGLSDLVELQGRMAAARDAAATAAGGSPSAAPAVPLDALPAVDFRGVALQFAPQDAPELGVERGMKLKGELWLPLSADGQMSNFAGVDIGVTEDGLWARGHLSAFTLGPLVWDDAELDLTATKETQHLIVKGQIELMGTRQLVDLTVSRDVLAFRTETRMWDMFSADIQAQAAFNLTRPDFQVDAVVSADFGDAVGPLMQQGIVAFAAAGEDVMAAAGAAAHAAEQALAIPEATVDELRRVLEAQRQIAFNAMTQAAATAAARRNTMNSAWSARGRAWNTYRATPAFPAWRKAQTLNAYRAAHGTYLRYAIAYNGSVAVWTAAQRVHNAIPPVDQNIHLMRAEAALALLRTQLRTMQDNLAAAENQFAAINAAVSRGEQLVVIERAEFSGGLQSAMNGDPVRWGIRGAFIGEPFRIEETMNFANVGEGVSQMLRSLLRG